MECLDANAVQDLMSGALDHAARGRAVLHLDGCEECRGLISLLARDATRAAALDTLRTHQGGAVGTLVETMASLAGNPALRTLDPLGATADANDVDGQVRVRTPAQVGKMIGRYTLVERIGAGAMGIVYRADDPGLGRRVALKLLHKPDEALTDRLVREARSMAQVNHPNVVAVYDAGVSEGATYIAMELVTGSSLRIWQQAARPLADTIETYIAAGRGLAAAHAAGIVHRDFKPDNVLVGSDGRVRVTDFGLSSARPSEEVGPGVSDLELTRSGMVLGTPAYMAPEQFSGGNVDPRTDQFNFCVALYEALYGERPFRGKTFEELGDNVCDGKIRPAPARSRVSGELRKIVLRGLSVRPGDRYPTMDHLLDDLGRDRARPWRRASFAATALAVTLGLGFGADFVVRDRVSAENDQSFTATGVQIERAFKLLAGRFDANANQMYLQSAMRDTTSHRDQADFGLGEATEDQVNLERIHSQLASTDWDLWRKLAGKEYPIVVAVADYKARLLYTSASPTWHTDLKQLPWIKSALDSGREKTIVLQRTDDDKLVKTGILGTQPPSLGFFFARTLFLGSGSTKENSGTLVQSLDASLLIDDIRLDEDMLLSIVAPDGVHTDEKLDDLVKSALDDGSIKEAEHEGSLYQVKSQKLTGFDGSTVGRVVMANKLGGVLSELFPGARTVFALAALGALGIAVIAMLRTRQLTGARR
ncbi:MAG: protein kinase [Deltaproteobacteria bacterium]|nr:protein kinase [Deltaproteobacteria bacterium]